MKYALAFHSFLQHIKELCINNNLPVKPFSFKGLCIAWTTNSDVKEVKVEKWEGDVDFFSVFAMYLIVCFSSSPPSLPQSHQIFFFFFLLCFFPFFWNHITIVLYYSTQVQRTTTTTTTGNSPAKPIRLYFSVYKYMR